MENHLTQVWVSVACWVTLIWRFDARCWAVSAHLQWEMLPTPTHAQFTIISSISERSATLCHTHCCILILLWSWLKYPAVINVMVRLGRKDLTKKGQIKNVTWHQIICNHFGLVSNKIRESPPFTLEASACIIISSKRKFVHLPVKSVAT